MMRRYIKCALDLLTLTPLLFLNLLTVGAEQLIIAARRILQNVFVVITSSPLVVLLSSAKASAFFSAIVSNVINLKRSLIRKTATYAAITKGKKYARAQLSPALSKIRVVMGLMCLLIGTFSCSNYFRIAQSIFVRTRTSFDAMTSVVSAFIRAMLFGVFVIPRAELIPHTVSTDTFNVFLDTAVRPRATMAKIIFGPRLIADMTDAHGSQALSPSFAS